MDQVLNDWDQQGRLVAVSFDDDADGTPDRRIDYKSDDGGLRVSRTETGVETKLLWDHSLPYGQVVAEYVVGDEDATVRYTFGHQVISQERVPYANWDPFTYFYHQDGHSGVRQMARGFAGQLLIFDAYTYDAFGVLLNPEASASTPNTRQYRGEMRDPTTGLIDLRARPTYDPTTGRFGSEDPFEGILTNPITRHRFLYAGADPVNHSDPTGMFFGAGIGSLGGLALSVAKNVSLSGIAVGAVFGAVDALLDPTSDILDVIYGAGVGAFWGGLTGGIIGALSPLKYFLTPQTTDALRRIGAAGLLFVGGYGASDSINHGHYLQAGWRGGTALLGAWAVGRGPLRMDRPVNIGGEGEIADAVNLQPYRSLDANWRSATRGRTMGELLMEGEDALFYDASKQVLPFESSTVPAVYTNSVPLVPNGGPVAPGILQSEIQRVLRAGGRWIDDGVVRFTKPGG